MDLVYSYTAFFAAYLIGSLSFAVIVSKLMGLNDPRSYGSKNPGATNVLRVGGKTAAIVTLIGDVAKGVVPVLIQGPFRTEAIDACIQLLRERGSYAAPGFMKPEGIVVFHVAGNVGFKRTIEKLGLLTDLRAREFYEKPTSERKRKKAAAVKRNYKRIRSMQLPKKLY